jgi:hypothetical protein
VLVIAKEDLYMQLVGLEGSAVHTGHAGQKIMDMK